MLNQKSETKSSKSEQIIMTETDHETGRPLRGVATQKNPYEMLLKQKLHYKDGKIMTRNSKNGFLFRVKNFFYNGKYFFDFWLNDIILLRILTLVFMIVFVIFRRDLEYPFYFQMTLYVVDFIWHLRIFLKMRSGVMGSRFRELGNEIYYNDLGSIRWKKCYKNGVRGCRTGQLVRVPFGTELPFDILVVSSNFRLVAEVDEEGAGKVREKKCYSIFQRLYEKVYNLKMDSISEFMSTDPHFSTDQQMNHNSPSQDLFWGFIELFFKMYIHAEKMLFWRFGVGFMIWRISLRTRG